MRAFVPDALPPSPSSLDLASLLGPLTAAERALGRLDGVTLLLPSQDPFLCMYARKEAVSSSRIEGTQATRADLLRFETDAQAWSRCTCACTVASRRRCCFRAWT